MNKVGIELSVESGGFVSGIASAERAVESLTQEMEKAKKAGKWEDYARLQMQHDRLAASTSGFKRDTQTLFSNPRLQTTTASGASVLKMDADQANTFKELNNTIKKLTNVYVDQINGKDFQGAHETFSQLQQTQGEYKKAVQETTYPPMSRTAQDALKAIGIGQIANAITDGMGRYVSSTDRSGIVSQYGSGDIMGGRISEQRRQANLWGGIAQSGLTVLGTGIGFFLGGPGGAMLGGTLGGVAGKAVSEGMELPINKEATHAAYASLWHQRSSDAMELAALMGNPGMVGDTNMVRESFRVAAETAEKFGYSAEEGMDALNQAVRQGMNGDKAKEVTEQVFDYQRSTGADRGTLSSVANMSARYNLGDALRAGWAGLHASGMSPGQYNEYLRGIQRVMEEGISKGFTRSSETVAQNLTMLSHMTGNNPLWQGENGARRLSEMNAGLESTTALQSSSDILVYRAARQVADKYGLGNSYVDVMKIVEQGLSGEHGAELFHNTMQLNMSAEGGGREGVNERIRQQFGLSKYTLSDEILNGWMQFKDMDFNEGLGSLLKTLTDRHVNTPLPNASSPELEGFKIVEQIKNEMTFAGQGFWDKELPKLYQELEKIRAEIGGAGPGASFPEVAANETRRLFGDGYASQVQRILEERESSELNSRIRIARSDTSINAMLMGGRAPRDSGSPTHFGFFARGDSEDDAAFSSLNAYRDSENPQAQRAFLEAIDIMKTFTPEQQRRANEDNSINRAIPDVMTDTTGRHLLDAVRELKDSFDNMRVYVE
jgi:hypothetical protein